MKQKTVLGILIIFAAGLCLSCAGLTAGSGNYAPGTYEGRAQGFRGPVHVAVLVDTGGIRGIEILESADDESVGGAAMEELAELVLEWGSTDIDGISGATESSAGFLAATEDALKKAKRER
jgi:fumarate reductase flavoprotein subunit